MPVFAASAPRSSSTTSIWARAKSGGTSWIALTPTVFWAVRATIADMPWAPQRAKAFRSAWMPAPPPESEDAIVSTRGTQAVPRVGRVMPGPPASRPAGSTPARASGG